MRTIGEYVWSLQNVLNFWLSEGVDGFRVDAAAHLIEGNVTMNEQVKDSTKAVVSLATE